MTNISQAIRDASGNLENSEVPEPVREAKSILSLVLNKGQSFIIAHTEYELSAVEEENFQQFIERRANREPFQHIAGKQEFYGLDFIVSPDVLIPRPETELIVEAAIGILQNFEKPNFCEVGIGSGCIAVSILHEIENANAIGLDISEKALQIAAKNAEKNGVAERLDLAVSDVFEKLENDVGFELIVSNPPYIPEKDMSGLQTEVLNFDPHIALTDGKNGLTIIEKIIIDSPNYLKSNGFLLMEIGFNQSGKVREMFKSGIWRQVEFLPDLQGIPRMVKAQILNK